MKNQLKGSVYIARCRVNGKIYVGKTLKEFKHRKHRHLKGAASSNFIFHKAIIKHGQDQFDWAVVYQSTDNDKLFSIERFLIKHFKTKAPHGYNLTDGGEGVPGCSPSTETRNKLSQALLGHVLSEETKAKISKAHQGKKRIFSEQHKINLRASLKGLTKSAEHRRKLGESSLGRKVSDQTRKKMSKAMKGRVFTEQHLENLRKTVRSVEHREKLSRVITESWKVRKSK